MAGAQNLENYPSNFNPLRFTEADLNHARQRIDIIGSAVSLKRAGREMRGLCPFHNERTPSFYVYGLRYHCFGCGADGDVIDFVQRHHNLDFGSAVRDILGLPRQQPRGEQPQARGADHGKSHSTEDIASIIDACGPVAVGTAAHLYLTLRGLDPNQPRLYAHPGLYCSEIHAPLPALVAPLTDRNGEVTAIQRIWLLERIETDGTATLTDNRARLHVRKKTLGRMGESTVMLGRAIGSMLGIAEGVETALAASRLLQIPVWATCGVHRLGFPEHWRDVGEEPRMWFPPARPPADVDARRVAARPPAIWVPDGVSLVICGDHGWTGEVIAEHAVAYWRRQGHAASASFPEPGFADWNDELLDRLDRRAAQ